MTFNVKNTIVSLKTFGENAEFANTKARQKILQLGNENLENFSELSGIEGIAGDSAIEIFKQHEIKSAYINIGGNIFLLGGKPQTKSEIKKNLEPSPWIIGIKNPFGGEAQLSLSLKNCCIFTYEDFFSEAEAENSKIKSITIVAKTGENCTNIRSNLFNLKDFSTDEIIKFYRQNPDFDFIIFLDDKSLYCTENLIEKISFLDDFYLSDKSQIKIIEH